MAGSISLSLSQQFNSAGQPLNGGLLYFYAAGTTTPQSAYQDTNLSIAYPNPITLDSAGRVPQFYLADGSIKIRLTDSAGVVQVAADNVLVIGPSSGGGGGSSVDPTTILATGDMKITYGTGTISGFVRANGRNIGSATSGATERANADCQNLFEYLWGADANLAVSGGRGATAAADWAANKTIALPDMRGRGIAGLDDMGNTAAGRLATSFGSNATVLGSAVSAETITLLTANLPPYTPAGTNGTVSVTSNRQFGEDGSDVSHINPATGGSTPVAASNASFVASTGSGPTFTGTPQGGTSTPFSVVQPTMLTTVYIKL